MSNMFKEVITVDAGGLLFIYNPYVYVCLTASKSEFSPVNKT